MVTTATVCVCMLIIPVVTSTHNTFNDSFLPSGNKELSTAAGEH